MAALVGHNAAFHLGFGVKQVGLHTAETALRVGRTVNYALQLGPEKRAGAHYAGLEGYVQGALREVFTAEVVGGGGNGQHFGVGGYVFQLFGLVVGAGNYFVAANYYGANGYFAFFFGI